jgi:maltose O-acetyltransferase
MIVKLIFSVSERLIHGLAEIETYFSEPGFPLIFRKLELKLHRVRYQEPFWIGRNFRILNPGKLVMGRGCALPYNTQIMNFEMIAIGDDFISAPNLILNSGSHDPVSMKPNSKGIKIGDRVWCGTRVTILSGVTIGDDVVIGAGSVVTRDIPSNSVCVGVPARVINNLDRSGVELWKWYG